MKPRHGAVAVLFATLVRNKTQMTIDGPAAGFLASIRVTISYIEAES